MLHPLLAEFISDRLERRFLRTLWPHQRDQIYLLSLIGGLLFSIAVYGDYLRFGAATLSTPIGLARFGLILLCALPAVAAACDRARLANQLCFLSMAGIGGLYLYLCHAQALDPQARLGTLFLMTTLFYLCAPLRLLWTVALNLLLSLGYLWIVGHKPDVMAYDSIANSLKLAAFNLAISGYLWQHQRAVRINFWKDLDLSRVNAALQREVDKRIDSEQMFRALTENSPSMVTILDAHHQVRYLSPSTYRALGWSKPTQNTLSIQGIVHPEDLALFMSQLNLARQQSGTVHRFSNVRIHHRQGHWLDVEGYIVPMLDVPGVQGIVVNYHDVSELKAAQADLTQLAFFDSLTRLPNRQLFRDRLEQTLQSCRRHHETAALLFIDLDRFKEVNDTLGHEAGDQLLQSVAQRLTAHVRREDSVARLGGDEFTILLHKADIKAAEKVAGNILDALRQPVSINGHAVTVGASIGIAMIPADGQESTELMRYADLAMYSIKEQNRNGYRFFAEEMNRSALARMRAQDELKSALADQQFQLHYQPQFTLADQRLIGFEALSRWSHPTEGLLGPERFLGTLEQSGLIIEHGHWTVAEAIAQGAWLRNSEPGKAYRMAINLSVRQLLDPALIDTLAASLDRHRFPASLLTIEIHESFLSQQLEAANRVLWQLRRLGVTIAIDDFGTGYSSLHLLKELPIDSVKIDRRFIQGIPNREEDVAITEAVIVMAHRLGLTVAAEGVESVQQLRFLLDQGCDLAQGHLFDAAIAAEQLPALIQELSARKSMLPRPQLVFDV
ncbi:MAG TPA: EAL domain-containing protein [Pseudomonadales bacterium]|nr:EAL domain-containing protein [Pseudomonadales bacterium]HNN65636.1 EAL domain-containing protein [Pseudomonadales bacterium]